MTIFQNNKYTMLYHRIIAKHGHQEKPGDGKTYERHHIVPRSAGGNDAAENLTYLELRVHFMAHVILAKAVLQQYRGRMLFAVFSFKAGRNQQIKKSLKSRAFAKLREEHINSLKTLKWYNNGIETIRLFPEEAVPDGYLPGRLKLPSRAGAKYITDGIQTKRLKAGEPLPEGWAYGQKPERVKQISELGKNHKMGTGTGRIWINNGSENKYIFSAGGIPDGWVKGRLKTGKFDPSAMRSKSAGTQGKTWKVIS